MYMEWNTRILSELSLRFDKCIYLCNSGVYKYKTLPMSQIVSSCSLPRQFPPPPSRSNYHSEFFPFWIIFVCFRISYKWNIVVCTLFCNISFTQHNTFDCVYSPFLFTAEQCAIAWMSMLFIHFFVDGYLDCFQFGATMNKIILDL